MEEIGGDIYNHPFSEDQETLDHLVSRTNKAIAIILYNAEALGYKSVGIVGHGDSLCALNWGIKHAEYPKSYADMKREFYPQKGQALEYTIDSKLKLASEGRIITTEAANQTIEGFRNSSKEA